MILRKPYAFFIKIFKPIHILVAALIAFLIVKTNVSLNFFNEYIHSSNNIVGQNIKDSIIFNELFVIPIIVIIFSIIFLGVMFLKKKPVTFYVINILVFIVVLVITVYSSNFISTMQQNIVSIKNVKLCHDLVLINMLIESFIFILLIIRGFGINFKKFNFDSDIAKLNINDSDKEEFELNINIDVDTVKRNRKKKIRYLKYLYKENKFIINLILAIFIIISSLILTFIIIKSNKTNVEGVEYSIGSFNIKVNKSMLLKENYKGKVITEDNLLIVDFSLKTYYSAMSLYTKDFSVEIGDSIFYAQNQYGSDFVDLGIVYQNNIISNEFSRYMLIFEIPDKYLETDMFLVFNNEGTKTKIKLQPQKNVDNKKITEKNITEQLTFESSLPGISFKINSFDVQNYFLINYNYCAGEQCIESKEYIKPTINENFDKAVLKLDVNYENNSALELKSFYEFFYKFGAIYYKIEDSWIVQKSNYEELQSKKTDNKNNVYIGINKDILSAHSIKLVFDIRDNTYEYVLK